MAPVKWICNRMQKYYQQKRNKKDLTTPLKSYAKYSGIAFKMAIIIVAGTLGGYKLDEYFSIEKHIITLFLSLLSVVLAIYVVIKDTQK